MGLTRYCRFLTGQSVQYERTTLEGLPEVNIQDAIPHRDIPLLKTLAPAIRILTGNVVKQCVPVPFAQFLLEFHKSTATQFPLVDHHIGFNAEDVLPQPG